MEEATDIGEEERLIEMKLDYMGKVRTITDAAVPVDAVVPAVHGERVTAQGFWKDLNIKKGVDTMVASWNAITLATAHHAWRNLLPWAEVVAALGNNVATENRQTVEDAVQEAPEAAQRVRAQGYEEVEPDHIRELIEEEDLQVEMIEDVVDDAPEQDLDDEDEEVAKTDPTIRQLSEILAQADKLSDLIQELMDSQYERNMPQLI